MNIKRLGDPMYQLMMHPHTIDGLLFKKLLQIIRKKYGKQLAQQPVIEDVFDKLITIEDHDARFFAIMYILVWEHNIRDGFENMYSCGPDTLFGTNSRTHFKKTIGEVSNYVDMTNKFSFNNANVLTTIDEFKRACILYYFTKWVRAAK